jgi:hypothetical protein
VDLKGWASCQPTWYTELLPHPVLAICSCAFYSIISLSGFATILLKYILFCFLFLSSWDWIYSFVLTRQVLSHLSHASSSFFFRVYFSERVHTNFAGVSLELQNSQVTEIIGVYHTPTLKSILIGLPTYFGEF